MATDCFAARVAPGFARLGVDRCRLKQPLYRHPWDVARPAGTVARRRVKKSFRTELVADPGFSSILCSTLDPAPCYAASQDITYISELA